MHHKRIDIELRFTEEILSTEIAFRQANQNNIPNDSRTFPTVHVKHTNSTILTSNNCLRIKVTADQMSVLQWPNLCHDTNKYTWEKNKETNLMELIIQ